MNGFILFYRTTTLRRQWKWEIFLRNFIKNTAFGLQLFLVLESMSLREGLAGFFSNIMIVVSLFFFAWLLCCTCSYSVSSLAWFMSNQETSFVTLGQRVLANPLKWVAHYLISMVKKLCLKIILTSNEEFVSQDSSNWFLFLLFVLQKYLFLVPA